MNCPHCGKDCPVGHRYCGYCGQPLQPVDLFYGVFHEVAPGVYQQDASLPVANIGEALLAVANLTTLPPDRTYFVGGLEIPPRPDEPTSGAMTHRVRFWFMRQSPSQNWVSTPVPLTIVVSTDESE